MRTVLHKILLTWSLVALLTACGGGSGGIASAPLPVTLAPSPPPPQTSAQDLLARAATDAIIAKAPSPTEDQTIVSEAGATNGPMGNMPLRFIRYDATTKTYLVGTPESSDPVYLERDPGYPVAAGETAVHFIANDGFRLKILMEASANPSDPALQYSYSNLATWRYSGFTHGATAFGFPTTAMPTTGKATYSGMLKGVAGPDTAYQYIDGEGTLTGSVKLTADFATAKLTGTLAPILHLDSAAYSLGTVDILSPNWSAGNAQFLRPQLSDADYNALLLSGQQALVQGSFTGPSAQEVIGSFYFGFASPVDGSAQSAIGAFIAKRAP